MGLSRRLAERTLWAGAALLLAVFIVNRWAWVIWTGWPREAWLAGGAVHARWHPASSPQSSFYNGDGIRVGWATTPEWLWKPEVESKTANEVRGNVQYLGPAYTYLCVPLWPFVLITGLPAALLWSGDHARRRAERLGHCRACGYDRRGLAAQSPCPECGSTRTW
jgi:hypothetical protein